MPRYSAGVGDRVEVTGRHRLAGETGTIVCIADNPYATVNVYHVRFDRPVRGTCNNGEIWLGNGDFVVYEKASAGYEPPTDILKLKHKGDL